jgi:hypothetical protein
MGDHTTPIKGWLSIESRLREVAQRDQEWSHNERDLWKAFMQRELPIKADCACSIDRSQVSRHFAEVHLSWLDADGERKRYGRDDDG